MPGRRESTEDVAKHLLCHLMLGVDFRFNSVESVVNLVNFSLDLTQLAPKLGLDL